MAHLDWTKAPPRVRDVFPVTTTRFWETTSPGVAYKKRLNVVGAPSEEFPDKVDHGQSIDEDGEEPIPRKMKPKDGGEKTKAAPADKRKRAEDDEKPATKKYKRRCISMRIHITRCIRPV